MNGVGLQVGSPKILTALYLLYSGLVVVLPGLTIPLAALIPAAWCLLAGRISFTRALLAGAAPLALAVVPGAGAGAMIYALFFACALAMHYFISRSMTALSVITPVALLTGVVLAGVFAGACQGGVSMIHIVSGWADEVVNASRSVSAAMLTGAELAELQGTLQTVRERLVRLFCAVVIIGGSVLFWVNLLVVSAVRRDLRLAEFRVPDAMIGGFIAAGVLTVLPWEGLSTVGLNLLAVVGMVYFFQGLANLAVFMDVRGWPAFVRWAIYILIFVQIYMVVIVAAVGLFDAWFDFRTRIQTPKGEDT
jgi:hypothetical protein